MKDWILVFAALLVFVQFSDMASAVPGGTAPGAVGGDMGIEDTYTIYEGDPLAPVTGAVIIDNGGQNISGPGVFGWWNVFLKRYDLEDGGSIYLYKQSGGSGSPATYEWKKYDSGGDLDGSGELRP